MDLRPVHLHGVSRLVRDAHSRLCHASPAAVLLTELRVHVRNTAAGADSMAVLLPEQRERHAFLSKLLMDVRKVRHGIRRSKRIPPGEQNLLDVRVGDGIIQRPRNAGCGGLDKYFRDRMP